MCKTKTPPTHMELPLSKEWKVPMEVVIEMSLASTTNMELDKDLKKRSRMIQNAMSTAPTADKELLEQKQTRNKTTPAQPSTRALFIDRNIKVMDTEMIKEIQADGTNKSIETPQNEEIEKKKHWQTQTILI